MLFRSYKSSIILQLVTVAVIKICSGTLFSKKSYRIETGQLICKVINWLVSIWYEIYLLKGISKQTIVKVFFKDILILKKPSNTDSMKISCSLTLHFRLNSSKWKALYWIEFYVNCCVYHYLQVFLYWHLKEFRNGILRIILLWSLFWLNGFM